MMYDWISLGYPVSTTQHKTHKENAMRQSQSSESIKIYCTPQFKKQIKNIAALETKSISTFITDVVEMHFNQSINPTQDELTTLKKDIERVELLTLSLF